MMHAPMFSLPHFFHRAPIAPIGLIAIAIASLTQNVIAAGSYVPPEIKPEDILRGEIKQFIFSSSAIFPGACM